MRTASKLGLLLVFVSALACADTWSGKLYDAQCLSQQESLDLSACVPTESTTTFVLQVSDQMYKFDHESNTKASEAYKKSKSGAERAEDADEEPGQNMDQKAKRQETIAESMDQASAGQETIAESMDQGSADQETVTESMDQGSADQETVAESMDQASTDQESMAENVDQESMEASEQHIVAGEQHGDEVIATVQGTLVGDEIRIETIEVK